MPSGLPPMRMPGMKGSSSRMPSFKLPSIGGGVRMPKPHASSSALRWMTGGLGPEQAMRAQQLSQAAGVNLVTQPENVGEATEPSKLGELLQQFNRLSFTPVLNEAVSQAKSGNLDLGRLARIEAQTLSNKTSVPGINLAKSLGVLNDNPGTVLGKLYNSFVGAGIDMSANAANFTHIGNLSKQGEALAKAGQGILPGSIGDQMIAGQRNLLQFGPLRTTGAMDSVAGHALNYVGGLTDTMLSPVTDLFTKGKLTALRPFKAKLDYLNREGVKPYDPDVQAFHAHKLLAKTTLDAFKAGKVLIDPKRAELARKMGAVSPKDQLDHAIFRRLSQDSLPSKLYTRKVVTIPGKAPFTKTVDNIKTLETRAEKKRTVAAALDQKATNDPFDAASSKTFKEPGNPLPQGHPMKPLADRYIRALSKQTPDVRQKAVELLRKGAQVDQAKANLLKYDRDNPEVFDPKVNALADYVRPTYDERIAQMREKLGLKVLPGEEFDTGRSLSEGARKAREKAGYAVGAPGVEKALIFGAGMKDPNRVFGDFTADQVNRMALDPILRDEVLYKFGVGQFLKPMTKWQALLGLKPDAATLFDSDPLRELGMRLVATKQAVNGASIVGEVNSMFGYESPEEFAADPKNASLVKLGIKPVKVYIPEIAQKLLGKKFTYMDPAIANEFRMFADGLTNPSALNKFLRWSDNFSYVWRQLTLFGTPLLAIPTALKFAVGHLFLSWLRNGVSDKGIEAMSRLLRVYLKRQAVLSKGGQPAWEAVKATLPTNYKGINLKQAMDDLEQSGQFGVHAPMTDIREPYSQMTSGIKQALEKPWLTGAGTALDNAMSFAVRAQHYLTRLYQGWEPGYMNAAMRDTKHSLIDYSGSALTPVEQDVFRRMAGFYSWTRFNVPLMLQAVLNHPGKIAGVNYLIQNMNREFENKQKPTDEDFLDSFIKGNLHIKIGMDKNGNMNYLVLRNWLPLADLEPFTTGGGVLDEAMNMLNPGLKIPLEQFMNRSTFFKTPEGEPQSLERFPGEPGSFMGVPMSKRAEVALQELFRPGNLMSQFNPGSIFGVPGKVNSLGAFEGKPPMGSSQILGSMLGLRPRPFDEARAESYAGANFRNQFNLLRTEAMRAQSRGDTPTMMAAVKGIEALLAKARPLTNGGNR